MKLESKILHLVFATATLSLLASFAQAGPGPQYWTTLRNEAQFKQLKSGDKVAFVCDGCKSVSEMAINSSEDAMKLCKDDATVTCPTCKMIAKVVVKRQRNDPPTQTVITYVNDKGEECAFLTVVAATK